MKIMQRFIASERKDTQWEGLRKFEDEKHGMGRKTLVKTYENWWKTNNKKI